MMFHPGKKLLFMGQDFGQLREWSEERELDWFLLQEEEHRDLQSFVKDTAPYIYRKYPGLFMPQIMIRQGFEWINADDAYRSIFSFGAQVAYQDETIFLFVCNLYTGRKTGLPGWCAEDLSSTHSYHGRERTNSTNRRYSGQ